jgi:hypothetical protein
LGFTDEMIRAYPAEKLPLFSAWAFDWTRPDNLVASVRYALGLRQKYATLLSDPDPNTIFTGYSDNPGFLTLARQNEQQTLVAVASATFEAREDGRAYLPVCECPLTPLWGTDTVHVGRGAVHLDVSLGNGHVLIFEGGPEFPRLRK